MAQRATPRPFGLIHKENASGWQLKLVDLLRPGAKLSDFDAIAYAEVAANLAPDAMLRHFQTTELPCLKCGKQMNLTLVEPSGLKFELRTYKCIPCDINESFLIAR